MEDIDLQASILFFGTNTNNETVMQYYDIEQDSWSETKELKEITKQSKVVAENNLAYFTKGKKEDGCSPEFYALDTLTEEIKQLHDCPLQQQWSTLALVDGDIYAMFMDPPGEICFSKVNVSNDPIKDVRKYHIESNEWLDVKEPSGLPHSCFIPPILIGGEEQKVVNILFPFHEANRKAALISYNIEEDEWQEVDIPRSVLLTETWSGAIINGKIYFLVSHDLSPTRKRFGSIVEYDIETNAWSSRKPKWNLAPVTCDSRLIALLPYENSLLAIDESSSIFEYDLEKDDWNRWPENPYNMADVITACIVKRPKST